VASCLPPWPSCCCCTAITPTSPPSTSGGPNGVQLLEAVAVATGVWAALNLLSQPQAACPLSGPGIRWHHFTMVLPEQVAHLMDMA
jgi:hypothetical protein